jgi:hypothetical protein
MYRDPWKSDIAVSINGHRLVVWIEPCDCGGRHGKLTPSWWRRFFHAIRFLKTLAGGQQRQFPGEHAISDVTLKTLHLGDADHISVRIEVPSDAQHVGGINLFGEKFGVTPSHRHAGGLSPQRRLASCRPPSLRRRGGRFCCFPTGVKSFSNFVFYHGNGIFLIE